jgi:hypothetical protein
VSDERTEPTSERNRRSKSNAKEGRFSGDSVPRPLGFTALMPSQLMILLLGLVQYLAPVWSGPGVGAQLASQHRLILRSGRL